MAITEFFDDLDYLDQVDWPVIHGKWWNDTPEYPDRKRRRQAEFLVHQQFPIELIQEIVVLNAGTQAKVLEILCGSGLEVPVQVRSNWYY